MPKTDGANLAYVNMLKDVQKNGLKILEFWSKTLEKMIVLERKKLCIYNSSKEIIFTT